MKKNDNSQPEFLIWILIGLTATLVFNALLDTIGQAIVATLFFCLLLACFGKLTDAYDELKKWHDVEEIEREKDNTSTNEKTSSTDPIGSPSGQGSTVTDGI